MKYTVKDCFDCPLATWVYEYDWFCGHPLLIKECKQFCIGNNIIEKTLHKNCPLKNKPFTLFINKEK